MKRIKGWKLIHYPRCLLFYAFFQFFYFFSFGQFGNGWAGEDKTICEGENVILGREVCVSGTFDWVDDQGMTYAGQQITVSPMTTTTYFLTVTTEGDFFNDEVTVYVIESIVFTELFNDDLLTGVASSPSDPIPKYGFDDFDSVVNPWKSVESAKSDFCGAHIFPETVKNKVFFKSKHPTVAITSTFDNPIYPTGLKLFFNGVNVGETKVNVKASKDEDSSICGHMNVATYSKNTLSVLVRRVHIKDGDEVNRTNSSLDMNTLKKRLNEVYYNQGVTNWIVSTDLDVTVDLTLDELWFDGQPEGDGDNHLTFIEDSGGILMGTDESLRVEKEDDSDYRRYDKILFVLDNVAIKPSETASSTISSSIAGVTQQNSQFAYVFLESTSCDDYSTVAHELGHSLNLNHTDNDLENLMFSECGDFSQKFRKFQWDLMNRY